MLEKQSGKFEQTPPKQPNTAAILSFCGSDVSTQTIETRVWMRASSDKCSVALAFVTKISLARIFY